MPIDQRERKEIGKRNYVTILTSIKTWKSIVIIIFKIFIHLTVLGLSCDMLKQLP